MLNMDQNSNESISLLIGLILSYLISFGITFGGVMGVITNVSWLKELKAASLVTIPEKLGEGN
jgi:hypothetical protein